jgi:hypothetical protein
MNWYKKAALNIPRMYHSTSAQRFPTIQSEGLKVNSEWDKTTGGQQLVETGYGGVKPIFLSKRSREFFEEGDVVLEVNTEGLPLVADLPSLYDRGAYMDEEGMWFEEHYTPFEFIDLVDENGMLFYDDLTNPNSEVSQIAIIFTGTAACMVDIGPERIRVIQ